jgi:hypothetical protein
MLRNRSGSPITSRNGFNNNTTHRQVKRRPCQDIRGPQRLISYQIPNANPDKELKVIRAIIARETALADLLAHVSKYKPTVVSAAKGGRNLTVTTACFGALDQKTTELLLGMRITSIDVIEAIQDWRSQLTLPRPFIWQKKNYLQGMSCDVDFLHFDKCIAGILGRGRTKRNPLVTEGRNVDELAQNLWSLDETPKSVAESRIDTIRLKDAARLIIEEEMRCGKADHRKPPPTWYIQRKKRMLAMGINLVAGADDPAENVTLKRKSKPPPKKRKIVASKSQLEKIEEDNDDINSKKSPINSKKKNRKKKLLEIKDDPEFEIDSEPEEEIKICSGRKRMWGRSRDGRMFMSSAEAWLLPRKYELKTLVPQLNPENKDSEVTIPGTAESSQQNKMIKDTLTTKDDNEEDRMEVRVEISMSLPSRNGWCGSNICSKLVVSFRDLKRGGFISSSSTVVDALLVVAPPSILSESGTSSPKKKKGKNSKRGKVKKKGKHLSHSSGKNQKGKNAKKLKQESRMALGDAAISYILNRLQPTIEGLAWEVDGPFLKNLKKKFGPLRMFGEERNRTRKQKDSRFKNRVAFKLGRFWCAVSSWISHNNGLVLDIATLSSHCKRLSLDRQALERLLGQELIAIGGKMKPDVSSTLRPNSRSDSKSNSRPGSRSSSRPASRGNASSSNSRPNSRPSSRGAGSRPSSRGAGSRPSSRGTNRIKRDGSFQGNNESVDNYGELPPLDVLTMAVLRQCIVVVEAPTGPEFYAQPTPKLNNIPTPLKPPSNLQQIVVVNHITAPEIIAAANTSTMDNIPSKGTAGALMLSRGQENQTEEHEENQIQEHQNISRSSSPGTTIEEETIKPKKKEGKIKLLAQCVLVGGLYFMVDIYLNEGIFYVSATYPMSGKSIFLTVNNSDSEKCSALLKKEQQKEGRKIEFSKLHENQNIAKAILSRLDLDHELPPNLTLRFDNDNNETGIDRPLFALMATSNGMVSPVRGVTNIKSMHGSNSDNFRPLSPLLPIFSPALGVKKENGSSSGTEDNTLRGIPSTTHIDQQRSAKKFLKLIVERSRKEQVHKELSKNAEENLESHRNMLSNVEVLDGSVMRIRLSSPTKSAPPNL